MDAPRHMRGHHEPEEGETWHCKGRVTRRYWHDGQALVDVEVWVENGSGKVTTPGEATVILPTRT